MYYTSGSYIWRLALSESSPTAKQIRPECISRCRYADLGGYNSQDFIHDIETNHSCSRNNGGCEHVCFPTPNGPRCACPDGSGLLVGSKCSNGSGMVYDNFLFVSDPFRQSVLQINLADESVWRLPLTQRRVKYAAYDPVRMKVYWNEKRFIQSADLNGTGEEYITARYQRMYTYNHGIAVDIVSRLLYYTGRLQGSYEEERFWTGFIATTTLEGHHHFLLITMPTYVPRDIVLDHTRGMMYWRRGNDVEAAAMDGTQRRVLVTAVGDSFGLTIDSKGQRLYWCNGDTIESASLDGSDRKVLLNTTDAMFFTTFVGENLFFTDRRRIWRINVSESAPTIQQVGPAFFTLINGLAGYSSQQKTHGIESNNSCSYLNGGCEYACFSTPNGSRCGCPEGLMLRETSSQCSMAMGMIMDNFLLVADPFQESLYQINLANESIWRLPMRRQQFSYVAYDPVAEKLYWKVGRNISRTNLDGTAEEQIAGGDNYNTYAVAFDFVSRLWYYFTDHVERSYGIVAKTLDSNHHFLVIITRYRKVYDIVLDPMRGMMYWKDYSNVEAAAMDGTQRTRLMDSLDYGSIGLAVDSDGKRLYWYRDENIESMAVDGSDRRVFLHTPNMIPHCITLLGERLYYTDNRFVWSVDVSEPNRTRQDVALASFSAIQHIAAYNSSHYVKGNDIARACGLTNGTCKNIVFPTPDGIVHAFQERYSFSSSPEWTVAANSMQDNFLIVADSFNGAIYQFDMANKSVWRAPFLQGAYKMSFAYDPTYVKIYWTSHSDGSIRRVNLTGIYDEKFIDLRSRIERGIAIDVVSRLVYYTDDVAVFAMKIDGRRPFSLIKSGRPRKALVLDPPRGMMYWLNSYNIEGAAMDAIEGAAMDGTQHRVILNTWSSVNGLTIDSQGERLYWSTESKLESVALDGSDRTLLITRGNAMITGLAFLGGNLYYVDRFSRRIWKLDLSDSTPTPQPVGPAIYGHISDIDAYSSEHHAQVSGEQTNGSCHDSNGGCTDICLSTPHGPRCACWIAADFVFGSKCSVTKIDICDSNPCKNGGTCHQSAGKYECHCQAGITGINCETEIDTCDSNLCKNGGICRLSAGRYECHCQAGTTGINCETEIDTCDSNLCKNGGICRQSAGRYECHCQAGTTGINCETDIDECLSSPCQNGATCSTPHFDMFSCQCPTGVIGTTCETGELCRNRPCKNGGTCTEIGRKRLCICAGVFAGDSCEKSFPATLPASEKTRLAVSVKLLDKTFSNELSDKSSGKYKALKITVVEALRAVLDVKLGPGKYEIDGVTFTSGSVVVTYEVVVPKNESTVMQSNIITAIKKHSGSFAGSAIDGNYVSIAETTTIRYYGQFRVPDLDYVDNYGVDTSDEYVTLAEEVRFTLSQIYQADERVGSRLVNVTDVTFTKGSVIVDFFLRVASTLDNKDVLQDILRKAPFSIGGHAVDLKSVRLSDKELEDADKDIEDADFPWLPVILGSVLAVILLTCVIILIVRIKCNTSRKTGCSSQLSSTRKAGDTTGSQSLSVRDEATSGRGQ